MAKFQVLASLLLATLCLQSLQVFGSDPELTSDFKVPDGENATALDGNFFTFTGFRNFAANASDAPFVSTMRADLSNFRALDGLGISSTLLVAPPGTVNPPHVHPRASELVFVLEGTIDIGFVDTANTLRTQTLKEGDLFVVPRGLVHFQFNNYQKTAKTLNSFSSASPGAARLPITLFGSGIADAVLIKSFGVTATVIDNLQKAQETGTQPGY
ncbi:hypothetical protein Mapa_002624 [Marchantia paleacea]|nr:hypothetical protein Mapa_002624 [Marchantia paleacea]